MDVAAEMFGMGILGERQVELLEELRVVTRDPLVQGMTSLVWNE